MDSKAAPRMNDWWRFLTTVPQKADEFMRETYFREAWADTCEVVNRPERLLQRLAVVTFKPEAIVGRKVAPALDFLERNHYKPVTHRRIHLHRHSMREIWRFQWNIATRERMAVMDLMTDAADCLWVAFRDESPSLTVPGTVRFRSLKGSANPWERTRDSLRSVLGGQNRMTTFVHAADEPIDIVREIGILFDRADRRRVLLDLRNAGASDARQELDDALTDLEHEFPQVDLDIDLAIAGLKSAIEAAHCKQNEALIAAVWRTMLGALSGEKLDWYRFVDELEAADIMPAQWDLLQFGAHFVQHDIENSVCTIDEDGRSGWLDGHGLQALEP